MTTSIHSLVKRLAFPIYLFGDKVLDPKTQQSYLTDPTFVEAFRTYNKITLRIRFGPPSSSSSLLTTTIEFSRFDSLSFVLYSILDRLYELHPRRFAHSRDQWSKDWPNLLILVGGAISYERYDLFQTRLDDLSQSELTTEWSVRFKTTQSLEKKSKIRQAWTKVYHQMEPDQQKASDWILDLIREEKSIRRLGQAGDEEDGDVPMDEVEEKKDVAMNLEPSAPTLKRCRDEEDLELALQKRRRRQVEQIAMLPNASLLLKMFFSTTTSGGLHQALTPMLGNKEIRDLKASAKKPHETKSLDYRETDYISLNKWIEGFLIHPGLLYRYKAISFDSDRFKGAITNYWHSKLTLADEYNGMRDEVKETPDDELRYGEALSIFQKYVTSIKILERGWNSKTEPFLTQVIGSQSSIIESLDIHAARFLHDANPFEMLKQNRSILWLNCKSIREVERAVEFADALKWNTSIATLELRGNQFKDVGAAAMAETIRTNTSITSLNLSKCAIGDAGANALAASLTTNTSITTLDLSENLIESPGTEALFKALETNTSITVFIFAGCEVGVGGSIAIAEALAINNSITFLDLAMCNLNETNTIKTIADGLKSNKSIKTLRLVLNQIGGDGAAELAAMLKINKSIQELQLRYNNIGDVGASALDEAMKCNQTLTKLDLSDNRSIGYVGATAIADALQTNKSLTFLDLEQNKIGDSGAAALAKALRTNTSMVSLYIGYNHIRENGIVALCESMKVNTSITDLSLGENYIGRGDGIIALTDALEINKSITTLNISNTLIGDAGAVLLARTLGINNSLKTLNLARNGIGNIGAMQLGDALDVNKSITSLTMYGNPIDLSVGATLSKKSNIHI